MRINIKRYLQLLLASLSIPALHYGQATSGYNNISTSQIDQPGVSTQPAVDALSYSGRSRQVAYFDGLGRPLQQVTAWGSPTAKDMVTPIEYDPYGRTVKQFLPYADQSAAAPGSLRPTVYADQLSFYGTTSAATLGITADAFPVAQTQLEFSPLSRPLVSGNAGQTWQPGSGHTTSTAATLNGAEDNIARWTISYAPGSLPTAAGSSYPAATLFKNITTDEAGHQVQEYRDMEGRLILKKVQADNTIYLDGYTSWYCTAYVYDDFSHLRFVLPPKAMAYYHANSILPQSVADELCFSYQYDERGRMITKKVPGAGMVNMVYDTRDRLVMTQDANLLAKGQWLVTLYDALNRPVQTGLLTDAATTAATHRANAAAAVSYPSAANNFELLTQTYYDAYGWTPGTGLPSSITTTNLANSAYFITGYNSAPLFAQPITPAGISTGLVTGSRTKVLGTTGTYLYTEIFYDNRGRPIQTQGTNSSGGKDITTTQYDFSGKPLRSLLEHSKGGSNPQTHTVLTKTSYDHMGRVLSITKTINSIINGVAITLPEKTIVQHSYDELGQLKTKKLGNRPGSSPGTPLGSLSYDYNIRGWLLGANRDYTRDATQANYFGFELGYDKLTLAESTLSPPTGGGGAGGLFQYNGNISGTVWKSKGDGEKRKYDFTYDNTNRLLKADFNQYTGGSFNKTALVDFSVTMGDGSNYNSAYDQEGNIKSMSQMGLKVNKSNYIDGLVYSYPFNSNKLRNVIDNVNDNTTTLGDFRASAYYQQVLPVKNAVTTADYTYDGNGNMLSDLNKDISSISYNYLNLPDTIHIFTGMMDRGGHPVDKGTIIYSYDAAGNKLSKTVLERRGDVITAAGTTTYINGFVYLNDTLQLIPHEEGRIRFKPAVGATPASFAFDYFLKDHLGNVRMVLTEEQQANAYPAATMETAPAATEEAYYAGVSTTRTAKPPGYPADNTTTPNNYVALVSGSGNKIGPGITLKVMAGDSFNIKVSSWYKTNGAAPGPAASPLPDLLTALISGLSGVSATGGHSVTAAYLSSNAVLTPGATAFLNSQAGTVDNNKPKAYLNWILFDEQFKIVSSSSGFEQVPPESAYGTAPNNKVYLHLRSNLPVDKNGYLYVYVSNSTPNINVFFDNLQVTHTRSPILEETHYYPFGLTMAGISSKAAGSMVNKDKTFQGQQFDDDFGINYDEFKYRNHDPQIGRFIEIDPLSDKYPYNSTYAFSENKVTNYIELEGLEAVLTLTGNPVADFISYKILSWQNDISEGKLNTYTGAATSAEANANNNGQPPLVQGFNTIKGNLQMNAGILQMATPALDAAQMVGGVATGVEIPAEASMITNPAFSFGQLWKRAEEIQSVQTAFAQSKTTTAVATGTTENGEQITMVASSNARLTPAQRSILKPTETPISNKDLGLASGVRVHAEQKITQYASQNGISLGYVAASRPICPSCATAISTSGAQAGSALKKAPVAAGAVLAQGLK